MLRNHNGYELHPDAFAALTRIVHEFWESGGHGRDADVDVFRNRIRGLFAEVSEAEAGTSLRPFQLGLDWCVHVLAFETRALVAKLPLNFVDGGHLITDRPPELYGVRVQLGAEKVKLEEVVFVLFGDHDAVVRWSRNSVNGLSQQCGSPRCLQPAHMQLEPLTVRKSRVLCVSNNEDCDHEPPCIMANPLPAMPERATRQPPPPAQVIPGIMADAMQLFTTSAARMSKSMVKSSKALSKSVKRFRRAPDAEEAEAENEVPLDE